ncbi:hypothetical protein BC332_15929 [Capsicum chinense]|nr:hypothetical protein BC332_15929 [Capsicum chinense]
MKVSISYDLENPDIEKEMKSEKSVKKNYSSGSDSSYSSTDSEEEEEEEESEKEAVAEDEKTPEIQLNI